MERLDIRLLKESSCRHTHDFPQIILPLEETMHLWIGGRDYVIAPQELCYIPPDTLHQCRFSSSLLAIDVPKSLISKKDQVQLREPLVAPVSRRLEPLVELIKMEIADNPPSSAVYYLYYYLYRKLLENRGSSSLRYIQEHYDQPLSVTQLAALENYNVTYFNDWFKNQTGLSPYLYLRRIRVAKAKELLAATDYSVVEIAVMVGYNSHSAFTRAFRALTGQTPKEYRAGFQAARDGAAQP